MAVLSPGAKPRVGAVNQQMGRCKACLFWHPVAHKDYPDEGLCRRRAPQATFGELWTDREDGSGVVWPRTFATEGCGEFGARKPKEPKG